LDSILSIFEVQMFKHTEQFKRKVVKHYLLGKLGYTRIGAHHGVASAIVRRWVLAYRLHGDAGLRRKVGRYDAGFKLSVLQHMWENALSNNQVAAVFNIRNPTSIGIWEKRYRDGGMEALDTQPKQSRIHAMKAPTTAPEIKSDEQRSREELLKEVEYLRMENEVLKKLQALVQAQKKPATKKRK
jgi:transposase